MQATRTNIHRLRTLGWVTIGAVSLIWLPAVGAQTAGEASETAADAAAQEQTVDESYDWIMDEQRGRQYRVERIPRVEKTFRWVSETEVRFPGGATFEVVEEEEEWFHVKVYERLPNKVPANTPPAGPSEEKVAAVEAAYATDIESVNTLSFQSFDKGLPRTGQWRNSFDVADMNGDGHLDIVFGPARKGRAHPNIFLGDSAGNWQTWNDVRYAPAPYDYGAVQVGDLDGDGHLDMVFGIHLRGMFVARSDGKGGFEPWSEGIEIDMPGAGGDATSFSSRALKLVDWDGDGKLDIVALGEGPKGLKTQKNKKGGQNQLINTARGFLVYLNNGDGTWKVHAQERGDNQRANFGDNFAIDDLDGDGHWDLATVTRQLGSKLVLAETDDTTITYRQVEAVRPKAFVDAVEFADVDRDGHKDLILSYRNRELETWRSGIDILFYEKEGGEFRAETLYSIDGRTNFGALATGNLNNDGRLDIVAGDNEGNIWVFLSKEKEGFVLENAEELSQKRDGCRAFDISLIDLDKDSVDEMIVSFAGEPTGYPGFPNLSKPGCVREGAVRAWKVTAKQQAP